MPESGSLTFLSVEEGEIWDVAHLQIVLRKAYVLVLMALMDNVQKDKLPH